jgi:S-phase kinase-associated protein 1
MSAALDANCTGVDYNTHIVLKAKGGENFKLSRAAIPLLSLVKQMTSDSAEGEETKLPVEVDANVLPIVISYVEYHKDSKAETIPQPLQGKLETHISEWDKQYVNSYLIKGGDEKQHQGLLDTMAAAHYFDCADLLDLTCAAAASLIQDKNPEQIRALFGLPDDFTPEQRARNAEELKALSDL